MANNGVLYKMRKYLKEIMMVLQKYRMYLKFQYMQEHWEFIQKHGVIIYHWDSMLYLLQDKLD
jgi:hypothetical protein